MVRERGPFAERAPWCAVCAAFILLACVLCSLVASPGYPQADSTKVDSAAVAEGDTISATPLPRLRIVTEKYGDIVIELFPAEAPKAVERIVSLVRSGFYNKLRFHRVESYVIQTGAREGDFSPIDGEMFSQKLTHEPGMVGMARMPDDYDSARTQFYICKKHLPRMNKEYTLFGKVIEGMDIVQEIKRGDVIVEIRLVE